MINPLVAATRRPRAAGVACAIGAVALGLAYMALAGAPLRYLGINAGALVIGLAMLALPGRAVVAARRLAGAAIVGGAGALLATALLGDSADGATRWIGVGGITIQPSLVLLPVMLVGFARCRSALAATGMVAAAIALAIQPDRAMAGMLLAGLAIQALMHPGKGVVAALCASVAGFATTMARSDTLPSMPYVEGVLHSAFDVHALAGAAVVGGALLLLVPAVVGWRRDRDNRVAYATFGATWLAAIAAAALGNYPTPLVGYGGSAIVGYALSLLALPSLAAAPGGATSAARSEAKRTPLERRRPFSRAP